MKVRLIPAAIAIALSCLSLNPLSAQASPANPRTTIDQPDDFSGYQVHVVYVVPKDVADENLDTNGAVTDFLNGAQSFLDKQVGKHLLIDTYQDKYDITFLKSQYTVAQLSKKSVSGSSDSSVGEAGNLLINEYAATQVPSTNPKSYFFYLNVSLGNSFCGYATQGKSNWGIGFSDPNCGTQPFSAPTGQLGVNYLSSTFVHELFHSFSVPHVCTDNTDLMLGSDCSNRERAQAPITIDQSRTNYFGGSKASLDISKLPVWSTPVSRSSDLNNVAAGGFFGTTITSDHSPYVIPGKLSPEFTWSWPGLSLNSLSTVSCSIQNKGQTITNNFPSADVKLYSNFHCAFTVPATWQIGSTFTVTESVSTGPFHGSTSVNGVVVRSDLSRDLCPSGGEICVVGGTAHLPYKCWSANVPKLKLQQLINGRWVDSRVVPTSRDKSCPAGFSGLLPSANAITYKMAGLYIYRWTTFGTKSSLVTTSAPFLELVREAGMPEPTAAEIATAESTERTLIAQAAR